MAALLPPCTTTATQHMTIDVNGAPWCLSKAQLELLQGLLDSSLHHQSHIQQWSQQDGLAGVQCGAHCLTCVCVCCNYFTRTANINNFPPGRLSKPGLQHDYCMGRSCLGTLCRALIFLRGLCERNVIKDCSSVQRTETVWFHVAVQQAARPVVQQQ
jgi:hypothetical protein